jgi:hypothetical protein
VDDAAHGAGVDAAAARAEQQRRPGTGNRERRTAGLQPGIDCAFGG